MVVMNQLLKERMMKYLFKYADGTQFQVDDDITEGDLVELNEEKVQIIKFTVKGFWYLQPNGSWEAFCVKGVNTMKYTEENGFEPIN